MIFLHTNYFLGDQIKMRWAVHVACTKETRYTYRVLMGEIEGRRPLARSRPRQEIVKWILNK
jgi:hypothetical protein